MPKDLESLKQSERVRQTILTKYGEIPLSIWRIDFSKNKLVHDIEETQNKIAEQKHKKWIEKGLYDESLYERFSMSSKSVRGKDAGLSIFPYDVAERIIKFYSQPYDIILDPCAGHATRMTAAFNLSRNYIGYDVSKRFMEHNRKVLKELWSNTLIKPEIAIVLKEKSSEYIEEPTDSIDMIFTSPPYWCLTPETEMITKNGLHTIEQINVGTEVLTHLGNWRKVTHVFSRDVNEYILKIKTSCNSVPIRITKNHKMLAIKTVPCPYTGQPCVENCGYRRSQEPPISTHKWHLHKCKEFYRGYCIQFLEAYKLEKNDYVCFPIDRTEVDVKYIKISDYVGSRNLEGDLLIFNANQFGRTVIPNNIEVSPDFMRLAGYFVAEGCTTSKSTVVFTFGKNEQNLIDDTKKLFLKIFNIKLAEKHGPGVVHLIAYNKALMLFFRKLFGRYSYNKHVPEFFLRLPLTKQKEFLRGYWLGDGCYSDSTFERSYCAVTTSPWLAEQLRMILHRFNISCAIRIRQPKDNYFGKRIVSRHARFVITFSGRNAGIFDDIMGLKHFENKESKSHRKNPRNYSAMLLGNYMCYRIRDISYEKYQGKVYNLEVENDNSYTTLVCSVHNCLEYYGDEPAQLGWNKTYEEFLDGLKRVMMQCFRVLKPNRFCIFNVNDFRKEGIFYAYHNDVMQLAKYIGFLVHDVVILDWGSSIFACFASQIEDYKVTAKVHEYLIVMRKPEKYHLVWEKKIYKPNVEVCPKCNSQIVFDMINETHESAKCKCGYSVTRNIKQDGVMPREIVEAVEKTKEVRFNFDEEIKFEFE